MSLYAIGIKAMEESLSARVVAWETPGSPTPEEIGLPWSSREWLEHVVTFAAGDNEIIVYIDAASKREALAQVLQKLAVYYHDDKRLGRG